MTDRRAMKLGHIDPATAGRFLDDPAYVAEQKLDGARCIVAVDPSGTVEFISGDGTPLTHATSALHFPALRVALPPAERSYCLDGELLATGEYWVFDLLSVHGTDARSLPFADRRALLEVLMAGHSFGSIVHLLSQATDADAKRALLSSVAEAGGEGIVLKRLDGRYDSGRRAAHQLKIKFRLTCDAIVTARNTRGHNNAELGMIDKESVGSCSMNGKPDAKVGDVVEVRYTYATDDLRLYQPSLLRVRTDKSASECSIDQLAPTSKEVLAEAVAS